MGRAIAQHLGVGARKRGSISGESLMSIEAPQAAQLIAEKEQLVIDLQNARKPPRQPKNMTRRELQRSAR